jgi:hypothetical protein
MSSHTALAASLSPTDRIGIDSLLRLSAEIGSNTLLVQASSGNTSIKIADTLWIKASGKWLAFGARDEILVPVSLTSARDCLSRGAPVDECAVEQSRVRTTLRPSIEVLMHAALPHPVVVHVHWVNAIAWAVRADASTQLAERSLQHWTHWRIPASENPFVSYRLRIAAHCEERHPIPMPDNFFRTRLSAIPLLETAVRTTVGIVRPQPFSCH